MFDFLSSALSFLGGERRNDSQERIARETNEWNAQQYAQRYQVTVKDLQAAGLSPMLAYSQGPGNAPVGQQAQIMDSITPAVQTGISAQQVRQQGMIAEGQVKLLEAQADAQTAQAEKTRAETPWVSPLAESNINLQWTSAAVNHHQAKVLEQTKDKVREEIQNIYQDTFLKMQQGDQIRASTDLIKATRWKVAQETENLRLNMAQINALVAKTVAETSLIKLDVAAALSADNFGREYAQYKPIIDILLQIMSSRGRR